MHWATLVLVGAAAAAAASGKDRVTPGEWGGQHVRLTVAEDGAQLELDCAHGSVEAMTLGEGGRFDVAGRLVREHGGPVRKDETENGVSARYQGTVKDQTMTLAIVPDDGGEKVGPFELTLGGRARLMKCK
jgi:hypothetical protein